MSLPEADVELGGGRAIAVGHAHAPAFVILLHGFAMRPDELAPFAHSLGVDARFLFPEGPAPAALIPPRVTDRSDGPGTGPPEPPRGRAWWHIDPQARLDALAHGARDFAPLEPPDLPAARARLGAIVDQILAEANGRPVVLGGFSSGGMLAFDTQLRAPRAIRGLALLSATRIAWREQEALVAAAPLRGLPALLTHGRADDDLAFAAGQALRDAAIAAGAEVTWAPFDGGHEIPMVAWRGLRNWLRARFR
jgi:phospholipase/carboxylesterase